MEKKQEINAKKIVSKILYLFYGKRDIDGVLSCLSQNVSWIGPGENEMKFTYPEILEYFMKGKDLIPSCEILDETISIVFSTDDCCMAAGSAIIRTGEQSRMIVEVRQRFSFLFRMEEGELKIVHMHLSNPYAEMQGEEYFPKAVGTQTYEYLQQLLNEKTEVIDMITGNITGGLKGSNDDEVYSFFYVNEELPRMLGYSYDEFMEKTGGSAVGMVYPPDLPAALRSVDECFARGPVYSAEYRIEKKDKSLIWVMDSGRKTRDSSGKVRINSMVTDITPLKQALFDLEVERERYRIALENITDVMGEYDIERDCYATFQSRGNSKESGIRRMELENFSRVVVEKNMIHQKDFDSLMNLFTGQSDAPIEIQTRLFRQEEGFRWTRIWCSVIYDSNHIPVRTIGVMKDITEEKERNMNLIHQAQYDGLTHLLNQTEVKRCIQKYLKEQKEEPGRMGAMMMVDLDQFKMINDTEGHLFGNQVLSKTAEILKAQVGEDDFVGRIGGDEFLILIKDVVREPAIDKAENILRELQKTGEYSQVRISCSIGILCFRYGIADYDELFAKTDEALYEAKRKGRAQWVCVE